MVTGGAGRLGRYVLRELRPDWDAACADLAPGPPGHEHVQLDVLDLAAVRRVLRGAEAVCHLAGLDYDTHACPEDFVRVNTVGTWHVLQAAAETGVRTVVLASSSAAYGLFDGNPGVRARYLPVDEDHPQRPSAAYALSKQIMEQMGRSASRTGRLRVVALQPLHVVMPESIEDFDAFVAAAGRDWPHNYVAAADVARAVRAVLELDDGAAYEAFLVGADDTPLPVPTLDWYAERFGSLPEVRDPELFRRNPRASVFSSRRLRERTGWAPQLTLADLRA